MTKQIIDLSQHTGTLEHDLLEIELRAMAQKEAARAFARVVRRGVARTRQFFAGNRAPSVDSDLRSA